MMELEYEQNSLFGINPIFNMHKIKFDILNRWDLLKGYSKANVFINLDNVIKLMLSMNTNNLIHAAINTLEIGEDYLKTISLGLVSNIINLGQHYRLWLAKHGVDSNIVLFWGYPPNKYKNDSYISNYRKSYIQRFNNRMNYGYILTSIEKAVEFLSTCIQYVNEVYLIHSGELEPSLMPLLISEKFQSEQKHELNLLVSTDIYDYAYVNYGFTVLVPSIRKSSEPKLVTKETCMDILKKRYHTQKVFNIPADYIEYINAVIGNEERNIQKMLGVGFSTALKGICLGIEYGVIREDTKDIDMLAESIAEDFQEQFKLNYHCTSLMYQKKDVEALDLHKITSQIVDRYDEITLTQMNEEYFKQFPIEIVNPKSAQILYGGSHSIFEKSGST